MSAPLGGRLRVTTRGVQIALGLIWLLDGLLQFQSFMYTHAIVTEVFGPAAEKQWSIVGGPMKTIDSFYGRDLTLWNTLAAEIQCAIGLGLVLSRRTVKLALLLSFAWAPVVWWFGEGFGGLTSNTLPSPLMGAPGGVILYAIVGLLVYPTSKREGRSPVDLGPLGDRGGLWAWSALWALSAGLWLANVNRARGATHEMIAGMAAASPRWLAKFENSIGSHTQGHGTTIAVVLAIVSLVVALGVWTPLRWPALVVGIVVSLAYWVLGQDLGGPFWIGNATDVNAGPLFVLLAVALFPVAQLTAGAPRAPMRDAPLAQATGVGAL
jgi:F0F1-type ATP synthase assembly protein I